MAQRQLAGSKFLLYRGNGETTNETFDLVACLTSNDINQTSSTLSAETKCGTLKQQGTKDATVPFALIPYLSAEAGNVAMETLQEDYKSGEAINWKATTSAAEIGDPVFSFTGHISEISWKGGASDFFNGSGTIQVDEAGVTLDIIQSTPTTVFEHVIAFASSATPTAVDGVTGVAGATDAEQKLEFNDASTGGGLSSTMDVEEGGVQKASFTFLAGRIGDPCRYTDTSGVPHETTFINGTRNF